MGDQTEADAARTSVEDAFRFFNKGSKNKADKSDAIMRPTHELSEISKDADFYNMNHYRRGVAIIFNHYAFDDFSLNKREGTMKDSKDLTATLENLKFDVTVHTDLKFGAIHDTIQGLANSDHSDSDCLLIAVLSHGDTGRVHARDHTYPPDELWRPFAGDKCPTLAGKPKIFFIQACRGDDVDAGALVKSAIQEDASPSSTYTIPVMADILVMYSTYDGFYSWRSPTTGSWFIQSVCSELKKYGRTEDLQTILTFVNRKMAVSCSSNVPGNERMHAKKQIGTIVSTFTRLLYFNPSEK